MRGFLWPMLLGSLLLGTACTRVTVHQADGTVSSRTAWGLVNLETRPATQPQIVKIDGFGVTTLNGAAVIGYHSTNMAILPIDDCRVVVWIGRNADPNRMTDLLAGDSRLCDVGPGAKTLASE